MASISNEILNILNNCRNQLPSTTAELLTAYRVRDLQAVCEQLRVPVSGTKAVIIQRLMTRMGCDRPASIPVNRRIASPAPVARPSSPRPLRHQQTSASAFNPAPMPLRQRFTSGYYRSIREPEWCFESPYNAINAGYFANEPCRNLSRFTAQQLYDFAVEFGMTDSQFDALGRDASRLPPLIIQRLRDLGRIL